MQVTSPTSISHLYQYQKPDNEDSEPEKKGIARNSSNPKKKIPEEDTQNLTTTPHAEPGLNRRQISVLKSAQKSDYIVRMLNGSVNGKNRIIVLLGEVHIKDAEADKVGVKVLREFPLRGLESLSTSKALTLFWNGLDRATGFLTFRNYPSTIDRALEANATPGEIHNIMLEKNVSPHISSFITMQFLHAFYSATTLFNKQIHIRTIRDYNNPDNWPNYLDYYSFFQIAYLGLDLAINLTPLCDMVNSCDENSVLSRVKKYLFPFCYYIQDHRNFAMCRSIISTFCDDPEKETMLVITGQAHTSKLATILRKTYNFQQCDFHSH